MLLRFRGEGEYVDITLAMTGYMHKWRFVELTLNTLKPSRDVACRVSLGGNSWNWKAVKQTGITPNRSLDCISPHFPLKRSSLASCPLLPASCSPSCLDVARYAFGKPKSKPLAISEQSIQSLMIDLG